MKFV
jgi:phosphoglycerate dehydrogenase-like enzyme